MSTTLFHRRTHVLRCPFGAEAEMRAPPATALARPDVQRFIDAHRLHGHRSAVIDPCGPAQPTDAPELLPIRYGLRPAEGLTTDDSTLLGATRVHELDRSLKAIYCGPLALDSSAVREDRKSVV